MARVLVSFWLEEVLAVVAAKGEGEAVQVAAQSVQAVGGVADVGQQRWRQRAGAAARAAIAAQQHRGKPRAMTTISAEVSLSTAQGQVHARPTPASPCGARPTPKPPNGRSCTQLRSAQRRAEFHGSLAGDLPAADAQFLADSQVPWAVDALGGEDSQPTWRAKPCWYLVTTEDRMIPPAAQRAIADRAGASAGEIAASHAVYVSQPQVVADLIKQAAAAAGG